MLSPEILSVPESLPSVSRLDDASARDSRARSVNMKLKSSGKSPESEAVPTPVIIPSPLLALKPSSVILSPSLLSPALAPVKDSPIAFMDLAVMLTLILSSADRSPSSAVVSSRPSAEIMSITRRLGDVARRLTEGLSESPEIFIPAFTVPVMSLLPMAGRYALTASGVIVTVALMLRRGASDGTGDIVPVMLTGIPLSVPSVLVSVRVFPVKENSTAGWVMVCPIAENSGLFTEPVTSKDDGEPLTVTLAVIFPEGLYCGASGIMLSIRFMSRSAIFAVRSITGSVRKPATFPLMYPDAPSKANFPSTLAVSL